VNDQASSKQQIVEKIRNSTNILVTVSTDPTVDELTAALGLTVLLNKLKKHTTAVVSGEIPPAIDFLEPGKTFESTVDGLRDFIIALDKDKADHLRYKVDGDVVKIFVTPYRTTITSDDIEFSQGDYNVELVLALGVKNRDSLDKALAAHGRILHDATVATISTDEPSKLGSIDWRDTEASSLSEMLVALSEALKDDTPLLDEQIATAFLTGIVAATNRFSNDRTSSRVMTMAAQLMAAGANQQLIAAKLEAAEEISRPADKSESEPERPDGTVPMNENESTKLDRKPKKSSKKKAKQDNSSGTLVIDHDNESTPPKEETESDSAMTPEQEAEVQLAKQLDGLASPSSAPTISVEDLQADIKQASQQLESAAESETTDGDQSADTPAVEQPAVEAQPAVLDNTPQSTPEHSVVTDAWQPPAYEETPAPTFGGTLNATTEAAAEEKRREEESNRNRTILQRKAGRLPDAPEQVGSPINAAGAPSDQAPTIDPFVAAANAPKLVDGQLAPTAHAAPLEPLNPIAEPTLADLDQQHRGVEAPADAAARAEVEAAFGAVPFEPSQPTSENLPPQPGDLPVPPPLPDFSSLPPMPPGQLPVQPPADSPEVLGDVFGSQPPAPPTPPQGPEDPGQFRIPGQ